MRTIIEINGTVYEVVPQRYGCENWVSSCEQCDAHRRDVDGWEYCTVVEDFDCRQYDTDRYGVHLALLAKPSISLNTPSEARRRATV